MMASFTRGAMGPSRPPTLALPDTCTASLEGHKGAVLVARWNADGSYALSGGRDKRIVLWNPHKGTQVKAYEGAHGYEVLDIAVTHDNSRFASVGGDNVAFVWDVMTGSVVRRFRGHTGRINTCAWNVVGLTNGGGGGGGGGGGRGGGGRIKPNGGSPSSVLVTGGQDGSVRCWDCRSNNKAPIQTISAAQASVTTVVTTGAAEIVFCSVDGRIRCIDVRNGKIVTDRVGHPLNSVRVTRDGNGALVSCLDSTVRLFDRRDGCLLNSFTGHANSKYQLEAVLSAEDDVVASCSEDGSIYLWDIVNASSQSVIKNAHARAVVSLDYHPKGQASLLSAGVDGCVKVWKAASQ